MTLNLNVFSTFNGTQHSGLLIIVVLGCCIVLGFRWMLGDLNHYSVIPVMDSWGENGAVGSLNEWENVRDTLAFSQQLDGGEAEYYRLMGLGYDWRGFAIVGEEVSATDLIASRNTALGAYREMVRLRPADPAGWAHLARLKIMTGERDDEFRIAVRNALVLGGNKAEVLEEVAFAVSLGWSAVRDDEGLKGLFVEKVASYLERGQSPSAVLNNLQSTSAVLGEICARIGVGTMSQVVQGVCVVD